MDMLGLSNRYIDCREMIDQALKEGPETCDPSQLHFAIQRGFLRCVISPIATHTFPPRSFEFTVTTTDPMVMSEMTSENTCIDCSLGAYG